MFLADRAQLRPAHATLLTGTESDRRDRMRLHADRDRFTLGAVLLRGATARLTGLDPRDVPVDRRCEQCGRPHGRPRLPGSGLEASVAHSGDLVAVAIAAAGRVGVDVEHVAALPDAALLASVCTDAERVQVRTPTDFAAYWTRKEAVLKATGEGLSTDMLRVEVSPPQSVPALRRLAGEPGIQCRMADVPVAGYAGAVAVLTGAPVQFTVLPGDALLGDLRVPR